MGKRGVRRYIRSFFDIPRWMGVNYLKHTAVSMRDLARTMFTIRKPEHEESFEQACKRLGLSEADVSERCQTFLRKAQVYLICCLLVLCYFIYLMLHGHYQASFLTASLTLMLFAFFFREHFWYTQIKHRRLGFTFAEWVKSLWTSTASNAS